MKLPEWANWLARDEAGSLMAFERKPHKDMDDLLWSEPENYGDSISFDETNRVVSINETDDTFSHIKLTDEEPTEIKRGLETGGVSVEELNRIANAKAHGYDEVPTTDVVNRPKHYVGIYGLEVETVLENFLPKIKDGYVAHRVGSLLEYVLRHPEKNGIEDLGKAEKNMRQVFAYLKNKG